MNKIAAGLVIDCYFAVCSKYFVKIRSANRWNFKSRILKSLYKLEFHSKYTLYEAVKGRGKFTPSSASNNLTTEKWKHVG